MHNFLLATCRFQNMVDYAQRSMPVASLKEAAALFGSRLGWG